MTAEIPDREPTAVAIEPFGEAALLVTLGHALDIRTARRAQALAGKVREMAAADARWGEAVPAAASVLVRFDPLILELEEARTTVAALLELVPRDTPRPAEPREHTLTVRYGDVDGPDLATIAAEAGLMPDDVIDLHAAAEYEVAFLGFAPGFAYLLTVADRIALPRLATPRPRVEAGSVGIAGRATGVYPAALPGGWRIIGRTDARLFDPSAPDPVRLRPGDHVRFRAR